MARLTVLDWKRVVLYRHGKLVTVLGPGRHRIPRRHVNWYAVDMRPAVYIVPGQEVLTADSLAVRVSVLAELVVTDAVRYVSAVADTAEAFRSAIQLALRDIVLARTLEQLLADRADMNAELVAAATPAAEHIGAALNQIAIRDIMLPGEVRRAAADVVTARQRGLADLERARSEAAALRSLANTARLLAEHPDLLRLRTLQAAESPGTTVVLTTR